MATELGRPYQQQVLVHAGIWIENAIMLLSREYQAFFWKTSSSLAAFRRPRLPIWAFEDWPGLSDLRGVQFCRANLGVESPSKLRRNCPAGNSQNNNFFQNSYPLEVLHSDVVVPPTAAGHMDCQVLFLKLLKGVRAGPRFFYRVSSRLVVQKAQKKIGLLCCIQCIF